MSLGHLWLDATDQGKVTLGLVIDLSKAFDSVNHDILLDIILANLNFYRVRVVTLQCFRVVFLVELNLHRRMYGYNSFSKYIKCRVPQESILGLVLFLLYISDLCNVSKALDFMLFADNTNTFYSRQDPNQLMEIVNSKLKKLPSWISIIFIQNKTKHAKT